MRGLDPEQWGKAGDILDLLGARYPILLAQPLKPLAIGTSDRLIQSAGELGLTEADIKLAMIRHTRSRLYLEAVARGGARYNLEGAVEGGVEPSQAQFSRIKIDQRRARQAAADAKRRALITSRQAEASSEAESEAKDQAKGGDHTEDEAAAANDLPTRMPDPEDTAKESRSSGTENRAA